MGGVILLDFFWRQSGKGTLKAFLTGPALRKVKNVNSTKNSPAITTKINSNEAFDLRDISLQYIMMNAF